MLLQHSSPSPVIMIAKAFFLLFFTTCKCMHAYRERAEVLLLALFHRNLCQEYYLVYIKEGRGLDSRVPTLPAVTCINRECVLIYIMKKDYIIMCNIQFYTGFLGSFRATELRSCIKKALQSRCCCRQKGSSKELAKMRFNIL